MNEYTITIDKFINQLLVDTFLRSELKVKFDYFFYYVFYKEILPKLIKNIQHTKRYKLNQFQIMAISRFCHFSENDVLKSFCFMEVDTKIL